MPSDDRYVALLGKAVYDFAYLEWLMKYLGWALDRDFLAKSADYTSNQISKELGRLGFDQILSGVRRQEYLDTIGQFKTLVISRDQLIHSNPYTDEQEGQRLNYKGRHAPRRWLTADIERFIVEIGEVVSKANNLFYSDWVEHPYNVRGSGR